MTRVVRAVTTPEGASVFQSANHGIADPGSPLIELRSSVAVSIAPFERTLVPTGLHVALPSRCGGFVVPDTNMAGRGLTFANSPGLVDEGYRGEVGLIAVNLDPKETLDVAPGDPVGTMLVMETAHCTLVPAGSAEARGNERSAPMDADIVQVRVFDEKAGMPAFAHDSDNGIDVRCVESFRLDPFERREVRLGMGIGLPAGLIAQIQPRSGLALKKGLSIAGSPRMLVNASADEELVVPFVNLDPNDAIEVEAGTRVAQLVVFHAEPVRVEIVESLDETDRGSGGFGSSGE